MVTLELHILRILPKIGHAQRNAAMLKFSLTDLNRNPGAIFEAAHRGPVELTGRGKRKFILLAAEDYDRIVSQPRRAYNVGSMTEGEAAFFYKGLGGVDADEG